MNFFNFLLSISRMFTVLFTLSMSYSIRSKANTSLFNEFWYLNTENITKNSTISINLKLSQKKTKRGQIYSRIN